jgi:hypothetical protein
MIAGALVLLLAAAVVAALLAVLPAWRRLMRGGRALPIHRHLPAGAPFEAEVRCALCSGRMESLRRATPLADCPNLELLQERKPL